MTRKNSEVSLILSAARFAAEKHRKQLRKGADATPYINHPLEVAERIARIGGVDDAGVLAAALLHDTIEDTETTREELEAAFGASIAGMVAELSDDRALSKDARKRQEIAKAPGLSAGAKLIKLADKTCNVRDTLVNPPDWPLQRKLDYLDFAERIATGLGRVNPALEADFAAILADTRLKLT